MKLKLERFFGIIFMILFISLSISSRGNASCKGQELKFALDIIYESLYVGYEAGMTGNYQQAIEKGIQLSNRAQKLNPSCQAFIDETTKAFGNAYNPNYTECAGGVCCDGGGCFSKGKPASSKQSNTSTKGGQTVSPSPAIMGTGSTIHGDVIIIDESRVDKAASNVAIGKNAKENIGSSKVKGSNVKGTVINKARVKKSANVAIGKNATASMGSVHIKGSKVKGTVINKARASGSANVVIGSRKSEDLKSNKLDEYTVVLGVDEKMKIPGLPGELRVWIGSSDYKPNFPSRMAQDETTLPAVGESAKVEPFAPAFKIEPEETQCIKIHPSGSEVRFKLTPQNSGTFDVGANVYLFDSLDCSGPPIPKTAATLKVTVEVDKKGVFVEKIKELWDVFWDKLIEFWGGLLALFFALVLFLIRDKLKQWFGFEGN